MRKTWMWISLVGLITAPAALTRADEVSTAPGSVNVTTDQPASVTVEPAAPAMPSAAAEQPAVTQEQAQVSTDQAQDLAGTVQSVDRRNRSLILQDSEGKNIGISLNNNTHFYRRGAEIQYRDVEPNDVIQVRIVPES